MSRSDLPSKPVVTADDAGVIHVSGPVNVETVGLCRDEGVALMADGVTVVFDLTEAEAAGSAAIALLIAWQREMRGRDGDIRVIGASDQLLAIADACGVADIIPFA